jgi:hypothetical protein
MKILMLLCVLMSSLPFCEWVAAQSTGGIPVIRNDANGLICQGPAGPLPCTEAAKQFKAQEASGPCGGYTGCLHATVIDPLTPWQVKRDCTGMDWVLSICKHAGCPRGCTAYSTEWRHMEDTFIAYVQVPNDWDQQLRDRVDGAAKQCWAEGYQAAGYATLEGLIIAAASHGTTASGIPAYVIGQTQQALQRCLENEGHALGVDLAHTLTPQIQQVSSGWSPWQ